MTLEPEIMLIKDEGILCQVLQRLGHVSKVGFFSRGVKHVTYVENDELEEVDWSTD